MKEKTVILLNDKIIAIVADKDTAVYFGKFLTGMVDIRPISYFDFYYNEIKEFIGEK